MTQSTANLSPRLSAFEFFVGFEPLEIAYLEEKVLCRLKECLRVFINRVKSNSEIGTDLTQFEQKKAPAAGGFTGYVFRSEDCQSFGGEDHHHDGVNAFD